MSKVNDTHTGHFTLNKSEFASFIRLGRLNKPEYKDWSVSSVFCGWTTVHVPNFKGTMPDFYSSFDRRLHPEGFLNN
jgi:hypothetical protein